MDIEERCCEHIKFSSEDAICSNSVKSINDLNGMCQRLLIRK